MHNWPTPDTPHGNQWGADGRKCHWPCGAYTSDFLGWKLVRIVYLTWTEVLLTLAALAPV